MELDDVKKIAKEAAEQAVQKAAESNKEVPIEILVFIFTAIFACISFLFIAHIQRSKQVIELKLSDREIISKLDIVIKDISGVAQRLDAFMKSEVEYLKDLTLKNK